MPHHKRGVVAPAEEQRVDIDDLHGAVGPSPPKLSQMPAVGRKHLPADHVDAIADELDRFSPALAEQERWLVFNKIDLMADDEARERADAIVEELGWEGPVHLISAAAGVGCEELVYALMNALEDRRRLEEEDPEYAAGQRELRSRLEQEARERVQEIKQENRRRRDDNNDDDDDDDDHDVEIVYEQ